MKLISKELQSDELFKIEELLIKHALPIKFVEIEIKNLEKAVLNLDKINISTLKVQYLDVSYIKKVSEKCSRNITKILDQIGI